MMGTFRSRLSRTLQAPRRLLNASEWSRRHENELLCSAGSEGREPMLHVWTDPTHLAQW